MRFLLTPRPNEQQSPREDVRAHLVHSIHVHACDVTHTTQRRGSPYSLALVKTTGSYERAVKQWAKYAASLKSLESLE